MALVLKLKCGSEIYRVRLPADQDLTYEATEVVINKMRPEGGFQPKYRDEDGDLCTLNGCTFPDFVAQTSQKAAGKQTYELELVPVCAASDKTPEPDPSAAGAAWSDSVGSDGSDSSCESNSEEEEEIPEGVARGFLDALVAEYVLHERSGVGKFFKRCRGPRSMANGLRHIEDRIRRERDPAGAIARLASKWGMPCTEGCNSMSSCPAEQQSQSDGAIEKNRGQSGCCSRRVFFVVHGAPVPEEIARGFMDALVAEYVRDQHGGVGKFAKRVFMPREVANQLSCIEDWVSKERDAAGAIALLASKWCLPCPEGCIGMSASAAEPQSQEGGAPVPTDVARGFLSALAAEYVHNEDGGVCKFFKINRVPRHLISILEFIEDQFRKEPDAVEGIAKLAAQWGLSSPVEQPQTRAIEVEAEEKSAEVQKKSAILDPQTHFEFSVPVAVGDGSHLTLQWNRSDEPLVVAATFAADYGIPEEEVPNITAYVHQITAACVASA